MSSKSSTTQQQLQLDTTTEKSSDPERQVIMTANGSKKAAETVFRTGALVGMESANIRPPEEIPVEFVDWPFTKGGDVDSLWEQHLHAVKRERPRLAVAPDAMGQTHLQDALDFADDLAEYADDVIIVPKNCHPRAVPDEYRTGMPCQPRFGKPVWAWTDYQECESVHLLGGGPSKHQEILKYYINVESVDTTSPIKAAQFGSYWAGNQWAEVSGDDQFYRCLKLSYRAMRNTMNEDRRVWSPRSRNNKMDYESAFRELDDTGLFHANDPVPRPPRAAYYECDSPEELAAYVLDKL